MIAAALGKKKNLNGTVGLCAHIQLERVPISSSLRRGGKKQQPPTKKPRLVNVRNEKRFSVQGF